MKSFLFLLLISSQSFACPYEHKIPEKNNILGTSRGIKDALLSLRNPSTVTKEQFIQSQQIIKNLYNSEFKKRGFELSIEGTWEDGSDQAFAVPVIINPIFGGQKQEVRKVFVTGGFARSSYMTQETLFMTLCHEVGHHIAGYPFKNSKGWIPSNEGQSDYFATAKCMKLVYRNMIADNSFIALTKTIPQLVQDECSDIYSTIDEQNLCWRLSLASRQMGRVLDSHYVDKDSILELAPWMPYSSSVDETYDEHPRANCRMLTYYQGVLCNLDPSTPFSMTNEYGGACVSKDGDSTGSRPSCWFKSKFNSEGNL